MAKKVTLRDIAREAQVSESAVSFVLNGKPGISEETRHKILEVTQRLDYKHSAQILSQTGTIGVISFAMTNLSNKHSFLSIILSGISQEAFDSSFKIELVGVSAEQTPEATWDEKQLLQKMNGWKGIIVAASSLMPPKAADLLEAQNIPVVLVDSYGTYPQFYQVDNDNRGGACKATCYLIEQGHREIAFVGPSLKLPFGYETFKGFVDALQAAGLPLQPQWIQECDDLTPQAGMAAMNRLMEPGNTRFPSAVFCSSDDVAYGVLNILQLNDQRPVSVVSMDDMPMSEITVPPLTTVKIPINELGAEAVRMVSALIADQYSGPKHVILENHLVVRSSVQPYSD